MRSTLFAFLLLYGFAAFVQADVVSDLTGKGFNVTYPGQNDFQDSSRPC